ncbi:YbfB/YjiJ family MFS transporter [Ruixingdingia sedimenti]|uniref:YbfB/YjiJ family MFS transporter n=1 Tax=Ruixingdingia sedimenti TaxID=3073604 RepID=A0ABU1F3V2_9RHOB|nr:YbfB/YjiJ family MFS transporter [Xinfangfangia sp. LG-4]MDR5651509.1 YbfB/YjiJ family MFS transporter [Xinfangfangia sp. LG-4]
MNQTNRMLAGGLLTVLVAFGISRFVYTPLLPLMQAEHGLPLTFFGSLAGLNLGGYLVGSLLALLCARGRARLWGFRAGVLVSVLTTLAMGLTDDPAAWQAIRVLSGAGNAFALICCTGIVSDALARIGDDARVGWLFCGMGAGIAASGLLVPQAARWMDSAAIWVVAGAISVAAVPVILSGVRDADLPRREGRRPPRHLPQVFPFWPLFFTYSIGGIGFAAFATFVVAIIKARPGLEGVADWVWIVVGLFAVPSGLWAGAIAKRIGYARALLLNYVMQTTAILLPVASDAGWVALLAAAIFGTTFMATPFLVAALGRHGLGGRGFGALTFGGGVGQAAGPLLLGLFGGGVAAYREVLLASGLLTVVAMGILTGGMVLARLRPVAAPAQ